MREEEQNARNRRSRSQLAIPEEQKAREFTRAAARMRFCFVKLVATLWNLCLWESSRLLDETFLTCVRGYACMPRRDGRRITLLWHYVSCSADSLQLPREREKVREREREIPGLPPHWYAPALLLEDGKRAESTKVGKHSSGTQRMKSLVNPHPPPIPFEPTDA